MNMKKIIDFIVEKKFLIIFFYFILIGLSIWGLFNVNVNYDMTKYLPNNSSLKIGMEKMNNEFGENSSIIVVFKDLDENEKYEIMNELSKYEYVESVTYDASDEAYEYENYSKYVITLKVGTYSKDARNVLANIKANYSDGYYSGEVVDNDLSISLLSTQIPIIAIAAIIVIFVILFILCDSWIEPVIFMTCIGIAILINMGTNAFFPSVSYMTNSIGALLQMGLSMDYSIMLMNSYNKYKKENVKSSDAMKQALHESFTTITSSSITTIVGLLVLVLMSFKIGMDMGLVLAKGILISLICIFTLLPGLIVIFDKIIVKTKKKSLNIKMNKIMNFINKATISIVGIVVLLVVLAFGFKDNIKISFLNTIENKDQAVIEEKFGQENQTILLYDKNESEENIEKIISTLNEDDNVTSVNDYHNTIGIELSYFEFAYAYNLDVEEAKQLYQIYAMINNLEFNENLKIKLDDLLFFVNDKIINNENYSNLIPNDLKIMLSQGIIQITNAKNQLVGKNYNRMIINTTLDSEGEKTYQFIENLNSELNDNFTNEFYLIGNSVMANEMNNSFKKELNFVTIISVIAIFVIVLFTFKNIISSLVLVCIIQGSIMITTMIIGFTSMSANYIALILVQCILMGATIDYGILFLNNYIKARKTLEKKDAIVSGMNSSIKTIITSSAILIGCCLTVALLMKEKVISSTCLIIAIGTLCAVLMIVFALPAFILLFDGVIVKKKKETIIDK